MILKTLWGIVIFRQLRNKDSAARSRERKRTYVKELEMKSKYLEGECRRLGRLLQCFVAENQALRLNMENGGAYGATMAKQESAVLLLGTFMLVLPKHGEINIIFLGSIIANSSFDLWSSCDPKSHRLQS